FFALMLPFCGGTARRGRMRKYRRAAVFPLWPALFAPPFLFLFYFTVRFCNMDVWRCCISVCCGFCGGSLAGVAGKIPRGHAVGALEAARKIGAVRKAQPGRGLAGGAAAGQQ